MDLKALNPEQARAADTLEGPLLVLAGAGSGKTRALTYRIANLIDKGVPASSILAITFTNKAAREMRERVDRLSGASAKEAWIMTFHACCARILRSDIDKIGYKRSFTIYDDDDQTSVVRELTKLMNLDDKLFASREIKTCISDAKNKLLSPQDFAAQNAHDPHKLKIAELYDLYEKKLRKANALDFDDLLVKTLELLLQHPPVLDYYRDRFRYVHVDEYQDTNKAQYNLIKLLASRHGNVCVVGDDDQSIYGWRGADLRNILDFEKDFPNATIIKLEQNYRSTPSILDAANEVIAHNLGRKEKSLWTERLGGDKITLFRAADERSESAWVCDRMQQLNLSGVAFGKMAVLYRVNAQSRIIEEMLVRSGIAYRVYGGMKFYDRKEVRDIVAYLRVLTNPADDVSLRRIINTPRRAIGEATVNELVRSAAQNGYSLFASLTEPHEALASRARKSVAEFGEELLRAITVAETTPLAETVEYVVNTFGLREQYKAENTEDSKDRIANIDEFIGAVREYDEKVSVNGEKATLEQYLENISLVSDMDNMTDESTVVTLMTLHSAKGLEFENVFLVGMEQGLFPSMRSLREENKLEEERRLCYVGFTRAMDRLYLSYAEHRMLYNQTQHNMPSQFLSEISPELLEDAASARPAPMLNPAVKPRENLMSSRSASRTAAQINGGHIGTLNIPGVGKGVSAAATKAFAEQAAAMSLFHPGDRVLHKKFGEGNVVELKGIGSDSRVLIEFAAYGVREFVSSLAPIVKVGN